MSVDKQRLYLSYFYQAKSVHHLAFTLMPKDPIVSNNSKDQPATIFHMTNIGTGGVWKYVGSSVCARTPRLAGLMLLCKVPLSVDARVIDGVLRQVAIDPKWICHDWVYAAFKQLALAKIIPDFPTSDPKVLHDILHGYVKTVTAGEDPFDNEKLRAAPVATCDTHGFLLISEVGPFPPRS